jgi:quinoprotein glucose dehydrogenase
MAANHRLGEERRALELARIATDDTHQERFRLEALELLADWSDAPVADRVHGAYWPVAERDNSQLKAVCAALRDSQILSAPYAHIETYIEICEVAGDKDSAPALAALVKDTEQPGGLRARALIALDVLGAEEWRDALDTALASTDKILRAAVMDQLRKLDPNEALARAEAALTDGSLPERRAAYTVLGALSEPRSVELLTTQLTRLNQGEIKADSSLELVRAAEAKDSDALRALLRERKAQEEDAALARWSHSLEGGDAARGEEIFLSKTELSCLRCHRTDAGEEPAVGPQLSGLSERLTRRQILISIVDPNRDIAEGFESWTLLLTDETVLAGRILSEDAENLVLVNSDGEVFDVAPADISERKRGLSSMPEGLTGFLSRTEMRDLIEYLSTL